MNKMKHFCITLLLVFSLFNVKSQVRKWYSTSAGEIIFSYADVVKNGQKMDDIVRFSPVFNAQNLANFDFTHSLGMFTGLNIRNVGFIYDDVEEGKRFKHRTYNIGFPAGIKFGNMDGFFLYGGYEVEFPFAYKKKEFINEDKVNKEVKWFSSQVEWLQHGWFVGVQMPHGINLKFKYYQSEFFNEDYTGTDGSRPYENFNAQIMYFSLCFNLFKNTSFYHQESTIQGTYN